MTTGPDEAVSDVVEDYEEDIIDPSEIDITETEVPDNDTD